ncbi:type 1 glutamine amidotransferase [Lactococcus lactis]|uniref:GMP synthase-like glutamine amidotransferase n=1 Tax=Lactococcus lactis TaxID=1358 RepID=A0AAW5TNE6_9LACT|nr:type 1 glutamine amidotransferase [Lactococcus lactis]MCW2281526.1 GMP synthase-like glutamine amidotransferase [Lactococcus lactis]
MNKLNIVVLQHSENEGPGNIITWANAHGYQLNIYHPYRTSFLPSSEEIDFLIMLGGPMSVNDNTSWMKRERELIKKLCENNIPVLGICFGAQQIAKSFGSKVFKGSVKEVGWGPIYRKNGDLLNLPKEMEVLHWHEETFELPAESELLYSSTHIKNQAFILNKNVIGLQFHLEAVSVDIASMVTFDLNFIKNSIFKEQTPSKIFSKGKENDNSKVLFSILDFLVTTTKIEEDNHE